MFVCFQILSSYRFSDQGDTDWKTIRVPPPESLTAFTLYNLQSDTDYDFQVFSSNRLGVGLASPIVKARTKSKTSFLSILINEILS